eukprot:2538208-Rhodomonas_salina.1
MRDGSGWWVWERSGEPFQLIPGDPSTLFDGNRWPDARLLSVTNSANGWYELAPFGSRETVCMADVGVVCEACPEGALCTNGTAYVCPVGAMCANG